MQQGSSQPYISKFMLALLARGYMSIKNNLFLRRKLFI
jgi:hypothetical protein